MGRLRVRGGLGRRLRRADATRLQLLPLPRGPRGRRGGSDVADVREGVDRAPSLSPRPRRIRDLGDDDRAACRHRSLAADAPSPPARIGDGRGGRGDRRRAGGATVGRGSAGAAAGEARGPRARAGGAQVWRWHDEPRDRAGHGTERKQRRNHPASHGAGAEDRLGCLGRRSRTMMDDRFMHGLERDPAPEFGRALRERLREREAEDVTERRPARWVPLLAPAALVAALVSVIVFPSVRASAQAFLDLFRVRNFTAVSVSPDRIKQLQDGKLDLKSLIGDRIQTLKEPGPAQVVASTGMAGAAVGFMVRVPAVLPAGLQADTITWRGEAEAQITADAARLRQVLEALDIRDVSVPSSIDGQVIRVKVPPVVEQRFRAERRSAQLVQSHSPEVSLPTGVNLAELGEIGLRILGLEAAEALRVSQSIDLRSTLLIPVPGNAASFRQVDVQGQPGLMVTAITKTENGHTREGSIILWSQGDMVFALSGNLEGSDLLAMASSVQ